MSERPYRSGVGAVVFNADNKVFVAERLDSPGAWQMPQGGIDKDEDPWLAALRELKEEIGTDNVIKLAETKNWLRYDFPDSLCHMPIYKNYCGQEQKWFAVRLNGSDDLIDLNAHHDPEFARYQWVELAETPSLIVPFKRSLYEQIVEEFSSLLK